MSLESDLIEVRKLCKAFAGLAGAEAALAAAVSAEGKCRSAEKQLASLSGEIEKVKKSIGAELVGAKAIKDDAIKFAAESKANALEAIKVADAKAKAILSEAESKANKALDEGNALIEEAKSRVDKAEARIKELDAQATEAADKLAKLRAAIATVIGK